MPVELGSAYGQVILDANGVRAGVNEAQGVLQGLESRMTGIGTSLRNKVTLPLVGIGVASGKMAIDLDAAMRNIQSVSKQTDDELDDLADTFVDLSIDMTKTTDTAVGLAEGFYDIQGSGFEGADAMDVLLASTKAASAGLTSTEVAAGAVTAKLNAYGEGADQAAITSDLMFRTVDRGVGSFEELSGAISNVAGTAANAGVDFDVVSAALSTMSKQGISFSEASVSLNQLLLRLVDPGEELAGVLSDLGYESGQAALEQLGLVGVLDLLADAGYDNTAALAPLLGNVRALRGALALSGEGAAMFAEDLEAMAGAAGATEEAFAIQTQSVQAQMKNLRNELMAAGLDIGEVLLPAFQDIIGLVKEGIEAFRSLPEPVQKSVVKFGLLAAAAGPVLRIGGSLIGTMQALAGGVRQLSTAVPGLTGSLLPLAAAVASVTAVYLKWQDVQNKVEKGTREVGDAWDDFFTRQIEGGADAAEVLEAYREKQARVRDELDKGGVAVDVLVRNQEALYTRTDELRTALALTAENYDEFISMTREAGIEAGLTAEQFGWLREEATGLATLTGAFSGAMGQVALSAQEAAAGLAETREELDASSQAAERATAVTGETMQARAAAVGVLNAMMDDQVEADERAAAGMEAYREAVRQAEEAERELVLAQEARVLAQLDLTEAATAAAESEDRQRIARLAMGELEKAYESGKLSFEDYTQAVVDVQEQFGLVSEEGRALALGIGASTAALSAGIFAGDKYGEMLEGVIADAQDGVLAFGELLTQVTAVNEEVAGLPVISAGPEVGLQPGVERIGVAGAGGIPPELLGQLQAAGLGSLVGEAGGAGGGGQQLVFNGDFHFGDVGDAESFLAQLQALAG